MENPSDNHIDPEDELRAENEVIKLKLELEHGMLGMENNSSLSPELENQWLNSVYNFEQQYKNAKRVRVYDFIAQPPYLKVEDVTSEQLPAELQRLISLMKEKGIALDWLAEYDDAVIYKFITEELFDYEMDDMMDGMMQHFTYEDFHPNHNYDLSRYTSEFINKLIEGEWNEKYDIIGLADNISFIDQWYTKDAVSSIIKLFQEANSHLKLDQCEIKSIKVNLEANAAAVQAWIQYTDHQPHRKVKHEGPCELDFVLEWDYWSISRFSLPGL